MDADRFTDIFSRLYSRLRQLAVRIVGNEEVASDAVQDTFVRLWKKRDELSDDGKIDGLMAVSVRNRCLSELRSRGRHGFESLDDVGELRHSEISEMDESDEAAAIYAEVEQVMRSYLSDRDREILLMREKDGCDFDEIARQFQMTPAAVRMALSRARKRVLAAYRRRHGN